MINKKELIMENQRLQALVDQRNQADALFLQTMNDLKKEFSHLGLEPLINMNIPLEAYIMSIQQPAIPEGWETWKNAWLEVVVSTAVKDKELRDGNSHKSGS